MKTEHSKLPEAASTRRQFIHGAAALGIGIGLGGRASAAAPRRGGTLKLGMGGGSTTDSLDPTLLVDWVSLNQAYMLMNGLVEINEKMEAVPELLESWEAKPGAAEWLLNVRSGVTFHNGKTLDADDVVYSLNLHRGPETRSAVKSNLADVTDVRKSGAMQVTVTLKSGDADLPYLLSDYHLLVVPDGFQDWAKPIGTGPFVFGEYTPGVRSLFKRNPDYWRPNAAWVDAVELLVINDVAARTNALISGQVHAINRIDFKTVDLLKRNPTLSIVRSVGGQHLTFLMNCTTAPFTDNNVRLAIKYGIDRQKQLSTILRGYGSLGNDHPIPRTDRFFAADLPQRAYDPDKSKFYLKKAGLSTLDVELSSSDAAFVGALDSAALLREQAAAGGITLSIQRQSADSYWDKVWMKAPFCMGFWAGRPTAGQMFSIAYKSDAKWNDAYWKNPQFDTLLLQARAMLDDNKRRELYGEMQRMVSDEGGTMIPLFADYIDATSNLLKGAMPHPLFNFMGCRLAERVWLEG